MKTTIYIDDSDILPDGVMRDLKIGDVITVDGVPHEVEFATFRNVRVWPV